MTYSHAKVQGQRSVGSKECKQMDGQTDGGDRITSLSNVVDNKSRNTITYNSTAAEIIAPQVNNCNTDYNQVTTANLQAYVLSTSLKSCKVCMPQLNNCNTDYNQVRSLWTSIKVLK